MDLCVTGLNHTRAPVELREKLAVDERTLPATLADLRGALGASEIVVISTCNRVEIYTAHESAPPSAEEVARALAVRKGVDPGALAPVLYRHEGPDAVRHLFRVASSLDSMVLGETQIIGQVKDAYVASKEAGGTGRIFNRLFQRALAVAKRVHTETSLGEMNTSVSAVAARLAGKIFQDLGTKTLAILGAGETAELTVEAFRTRGLTRLLVVNRTLENARALAEPRGGSAHGLEELPLVLSRCDIVIACLRADTFVVTPALARDAMTARRQEPMFFIDISVPRNIHPEVNQLENVYLYDIDDLQAIVRQNLVEREREASRAEPIIQQEARDFLKDVTPLDATSLLTTLRERLHAMGDEETKRALSRLNGLSEDQKAEVTELTRRLVNKILHAPSEALRGGGLNSDSQQISDLVRKLFGIKD
ncbi:MAG TPA: glutamyl-tRNA reductase [Planctomycetota bacterium]